MTTETTTTKKQTLAAKVREYKKANPNALPKEISKALDISVGRIYAINNYDQKRAKKVKAKKKLIQGWKVAAVAMSNASIAAHKDNVNHPAHYKVGGIETIDFIEAKQLNYNLGNVVKYITRADHKGNTSEDLLKARWYLNREIAKINKGAK
jgi:hypothetical protein